MNMKKVALVGFVLSFLGCGYDVSPTASVSESPDASTIVTLCTPTSDRENCGNGKDDDCNGFADDGCIVGIDAGVSPPPPQQPVDAAPIIQVPGCDFSMRQCTVIVGTQTCYGTETCTGANVRSGCTNVVCPSQPMQGQTCPVSSRSCSVTVNGQACTGTETCSGAGVWSGCNGILCPIVNPPATCVEGAYCSFVQNGVTQNGTTRCSGTVAYCQQAISNTACVPTLTYPPSNATMDNGRSDTCDTVDNNYSWSPCSNASQYEIVISRPNNQGEVRKIVTSPYYIDSSLHQPISNDLRTGLLWKVRAMVGGTWGDYSESRPIEYEPVDTDPRHENLCVATGGNSCVPTLISMGSAGSVDNGRTDRCDTLDYAFCVGGCSNATRYRVVVVTSNGNVELDREFTSTCYYESVRQAFIASGQENSARWRAQAFVNAQWGEWSQYQYFNFEPVGTDQARSEVCPSGGSGGNASPSDPNYCASPGISYSCVQNGCTGTQLCGSNYYKQACVVSGSCNGGGGTATTYSARVECTLNAGTQKYRVVVTGVGAGLSEALFNSNTSLQPRRICRAGDDNGWSLKNSCREGFASLGSYEFLEVPRNVTSNIVGPVVDNPSAPSDSRWMDFDNVSRVEVIGGCTRVQGGFRTN